MAVRRIVMRAKDVVLLKGIMEASEGLAHVFAESGGDLTIAAPLDRAEELDRVLADLCREIGAMRVE
jgi:hypothetical protein